jgi:transposase-like protein
MSVVREPWVMYGPEVRLQALALIDSGHSLRSISMSMGIHRSTLREWRDYPETA